MDVYPSFTVFLKNFKNICQGVWMRSGGLHLCTHICTHQPPHRGPFTGHTVILSWSTYQSACWWKVMS